MGGPPCFTTLRIGEAALTAGGKVFESDVRILRDSAGGYRVLAGTLSEPLPSLEETVARAETPQPSPPGVTFEVRWREDLAPRGPDEHPCPICGAPAPASVRYPNRLCPACVLEAADAQGRPLRFSNPDLSGGFEARYGDDGTLYDGDECFVRGVPCRAEEHRFGGVVVQPIAG